MAKKLRVLSPVTKDGVVIKYKENIIELGAQKGIESLNASLPENLKHQIFEIDVDDESDSNSLAGTGIGFYFRNENDRRLWQLNVPMSADPESAVTLRIYRSWFFGTIIESVEQEINEEPIEAFVLLGFRKEDRFGKYGSETVIYKLIFNRHILNINLSDLELEIDGTVVANLQSVDFYDSVAIVTINNVSGEGSFTLAIKEENGIVDVENNPLAGWTASTVMRSGKTRVSGIPYNGGTKELDVAKLTLLKELTFPAGSFNANKYTYQEFVLGDNHVEMVTGGIYYILAVSSAGKKVRLNFMNSLSTSKLDVAYTDAEEPWNSKWKCIKAYFDDYYLGYLEPNSAPNLPPLPTD